MKKIASVGAVYLDINAPSFPIPNPVDKLIGTETVGKGYEIVLGGSAVNFARFCKNLGLVSLFIGKTGKDIPRQILVEKFIAEGIIPALAEESDKQTNVNTNIVSPTSQSIMLSFGSANQSLSAEDVIEQLDFHDESVDMLYLGGAFKLKMLMPDLLGMVHKAKSKNKKVLLDHGRVVNTVTEEEKEIMRKVVHGVDLYLPSKDEFLQLWKVDSIEKGLALFSGSSTAVVVKDAENGAYSIENNKIIHVPAFQVNAYNTIGAGDCFNAGFIAAQTEGKSLEDSIRFANAVAALKISQDHFPTLNEVEKLLLK